MTTSTSLTTEYANRVTVLNSSFVSNLQHTLLQDPAADFEDAGLDYCAYYRQLSSRFKPVSGRVYTWGSGDCGQLGHGVDDPTAMEVGQPRRVEAITKRCRLLAVGGLTNAVCEMAGEDDTTTTTTTHDRILSWGCADDGALGRNGDENIPAPIFSTRGIVLQLACGDSHGAILTVGGEVLVWGSFRDKDGKTWFPFRDQPSTKFGPGGMAKEPTDLNLTNVTQVVSGSNHVLLLKGDNSVWSFGVGEQAQLGRKIPLNIKRDDKYDYDIMAQHLIPAHVTAVNFPVKYIGAGAYHSLLISAVRCKVYGFGLNQYRQVSGSVETNIVEQPHELTFFDGKRVLRCEGGEHYSMALTETGELWAWGRSDQSQLGNDTVTDHGAGSFSVTPARVAGPLLTRTVTDFACGSSHAAAITDDGDLYTWGFGVMLQLGHNVDKDEPLPKRVDGVHGVKHVALGGQHSAALI